MLITFSVLPGQLANIYLVSGDYCLSKTTLCLILFNSQAFSIKVFKLGFAWENLLNIMIVFIKTFSFSCLKSLGESFLIDFKSFISRERERESPKKV